MSRKPRRTDGRAVERTPTPAERVWRASCAEAAERPALLAEAEAQWCDGHDAIHLATAYVQQGDREAARRCVLRALATPFEVRVHRNAARLYRTALDDAPAAHATIAAAVAAIAARDDATATDWRLLAAAWRELDDAVGFAGALARAAAVARKVDELCAIAEAYREAGEPGLAAAVVRRAEAMADGARDRSAIATMQRFVFDDAAAAKATLARGVARIATVDDAVVIAKTVRAIRANVMEPEGDEMLARGEALATTAAEWIALAGAYRFMSDQRRCLDRAAALAGDDDERRHVDLLRRKALFDPELQGKQLGSVWLAPGAILTQQARWAGWPRDPAGLFEALRPRMDWRRIWRIAHNDYSGADEARAGLERICTTGAVPHPLLWSHLENLHLERWTQGPKVDHEARAFACALLAIDDGGPTPACDGNESTYPALLESCLAVDSAAVDGLIGLLVAVSDLRPDGLVNLFAELALVLAVAWRDPSDPQLPRFVARLVADEAYRREIGGDRNGPAWLLGLTNFDSHHALWQRLARTILAPPATAVPCLADLAARFP